MFPFLVLLLCSLLFPSPLLLFPIKTEENVSSEALAKSQNKNLFLVLLHLCTFTRLSSWFLSPFHQDQNCPDLLEMRIAVVHCEEKRFMNEDDGIP